MVDSVDFVIYKTEIICVFHTFIILYGDDKQVSQKSLQIY